MTKLIHTKLLRKYHNASICAYATSSVWDYCMDRRHNLFKEFNLVEIAKNVLGTVWMLIQVCVWLLCVLTGGFLLFPLYVIQHHLLKKELVQKYDVDKLNESAKKLEEQEEKEENLK